MVARLEDISVGTMRIAGQPVSDVTPKDRYIAMMFQDRALRPHMTVAQNIGFALTMRKLPGRQIDAKVRQTAAILRLTDWLDRKPGQPQSSGRAQ
jgi:multiple sugar transport system ATP-binding protein